jgi:hypothetical protein
MKTRGQRPEARERKNLRKALRLVKRAGYLVEKAYPLVSPEDREILYGVMRAIGRVEGRVETKRLLRRAGFRDALSGSQPRAAASRRSFATRPTLVPKTGRAAATPRSQIPLSGRRRVNAAPESVNPNLSHLVRAALMKEGLTLSDWALFAGISRTQVSKALHGRRTDARSRMIRAELLKLIQKN